MGVVGERAGRSASAAGWSGGVWLGALVEGGWVVGGAVGHRLNASSWVKLTGSQFILMDSHHPPS